MIAFHLTHDADFEIDCHREVLGSPDGGTTQRLANVLYVGTSRDAALAWNEVGWTGCRGYLATIEYPDDAPRCVTPYNFRGGRDELLLLDASRARVLAVTPI